jgi:predicted HAD superfamily Cof-like phosphohydrolase
MKIELIEKVIEFMTKFEQEVNDIENVPTVEQKLLRLNLINEEVNEIVEAFFYKDEDYNKFIIETADGLVDTIYVLYGIVADFGLTVFDYNEKTAHDVIFNNITPPEDKEEYIEILTFKVLPVFLADVYKNMAENNHRNLSVGICFVEYILLKIADLYGFPVEELFNEVHRSNMSKLHNGVVVKNELGKVVKSPDYSPADIKGILEKNGLLK